MSKGKNICPECGVNEKGIRAKTCRPCSVKALAALSKKTEEMNNLLTKAVRQKTATVKAGNVNTEFGPGVELELIGVDPGKPGSDQTVVMEITPEGKGERRRIRVGETTPNGKFYK